MKKIFAILTAICMSVGMFTGTAADELSDELLGEGYTATVFVAGDSTAASYSSDRYPLTGWAQTLDRLLPGSIQVRNYASSGRSSKSFVDEGRLSAVLSEIGAGDYFFIQFGHNDQAAEADRRTDPNTTFKDYLKKYIDGARQKGATPILITPIERRRFSQDVLTPSLAPQSEAMRQLAADEKVSLIDLNAEFIRYCNALGQEGSKDLFLILEKGESPNYPDGITDNTHLSEYGATQVAKIVLSELAKLGLSISSYVTEIKSPVPDIEVTQSIGGDEGSEEEESKEGDTAEKEPQAYDEAMEELYELGIVTGDENGGLRAEENITRAEFATLLARVLPKGAAASGQSFPDVGVSHWAREDINTLFEKGIINGYEDGYFRPENPITFAQAVKMIVQTLGYEDEAEAIAAYPWGYLLRAARIGVTKKVDGVVDENISRGMAAKLLLNAIYIPQKGSEEILAQNLTKTIYYISQNGSDNNDGTYPSPWRTLKKAAAALEAGEIAILEDGEYYESDTAVFKNSGSAGSSIVVRARTKNGARIIYPEDLGSKINIPQGIDYITIKNLDIYSEESGAEEEKPKRITGEFILCGGNNCLITGNNISANEGAGIKLQKADNTIVEDNTVLGGIVGIESVNSAGVVIRGNKISGQEEVCLQLRAGTRNAQVYNNYMYDSGTSANAAMRFGGASKMSESYDTAESTGFEAYSCVAWNNIITGCAKAGVEYMGASDCHLYNNIITGTYTAARFSQPEGLNNGWGWNPANLTPVLRNNIFTDCASDAFEFIVKPQGFSSNYNVFYNTYPKMNEPDSKFSDPYFAEENIDWHLKKGSPALETGAAISSEFIGFGGEILSLDLRDLEGTERIGKWSMGVYNTSSAVARPTEEPERLAAGTALLAEDFGRQLSGWLMNSVGKWETQAGMCVQTDGSVGRTTICYENGLTWGDYEFSVDIMSPSATVDNVTGIIFRSDAKMENLYFFRMYANNSLEFAKLENNSFNSIEKWDFSFTPDTFYNLKAAVKGNKITLYINNKQLKSFEDNTFSSGSVGLYTYRQTGAFDNVRVSVLK